MLPSRTGPCLCTPLTTTILRHLCRETSSSYANTPSFNYTVYVNRAVDEQTPLGEDWLGLAKFSDTKVFKVTSDGVTDVQELGETYLMDPSSLAWFIGDSLVKYPAYQTMLVMSDHGVGPSRHSQTKNLTLKKVMRRCTTRCNSPLLPLPSRQVLRLQARNIAVHREDGVATIVHRFLRCRSKGQCRHRLTIFSRAESTAEIVLRHFQIDEIVVGSVDHAVVDSVAGVSFCSHLDEDPFFKSCRHLA